MHPTDKPEPVSENDGLSEQDRSVDRIHTRTAVTWLRPDGIIQSEVLANAEIHLEDAVASVAAGRDLAGRGKRPILVVMRNVKSLDRDARTYFSSPETENHSSAIALVVGSAISRVIGNFMIGLNKTPYPTRLFTSEQEALAWLKGFLE